MEDEKPKYKPNDHDPLNYLGYETGFQQAITLGGWLQSVIDSGYKRIHQSDMEKCRMYFYQDSEREKLLGLVVWKDGRWVAFYPMVRGSGSEVYTIGNAANTVMPEWQSDEMPSQASQADAIANYGKEKDRPDHVCKHCDGTGHLRGQPTINCDHCGGKGVIS